MEFDLSYMSAKQFQSSPINDRKRFLMQITRGIENIEKLDKDQIIELIAINNEFVKDQHLMFTIINRCNESFLSNQRFINSLFLLSTINKSSFTVFKDSENFLSRYEKHEPFKEAVNKYCTYHMINVPYIEIDPQSVIDGVGSGMFWAYEFIKKMPEPLNKAPLPKEICEVFGRHAVESIKLSKDEWAIKLCYVLGINDQTLKGMCKAIAFKNYITSALEYVDGEDKIKNQLGDKYDTLKRISSYSKLINGKEDSRHRIFPT